MGKDTKSETRNKLFKLRVALEYAKKEQNELKIMKIQEDINHVRDRLKEEIKKR